MRVERVLEACLYVDDLVAAEEFYTRVLGLEVVKRLAGRHVFFRCGQTLLLVFDPRRTRISDRGRPTHGATGQGHIAFAVDQEEMPSWRDRLQRHGVAIEVELDGEHGGHSIYFRDPSGNSVELATSSLWAFAGIE